MYSVADLQKLVQLNLIVSEELGDETPMRHVHALYHIGLAGEAGIDSQTLDKKLKASQASVSRILKMFATEQRMIEFILDPYDGRRRLARLTPKGHQFLEKAVTAIS
jgi:DNA-binding MarR family transcriptional regulator